MLPLFDDERNRRKINLGGASSASSHAAILDQAKARRMEREAQRLRADSAVRLQAWWRGVHEAKKVKAEMRRVFEGDVLGLTGLRCLVLIGRDEEVLGAWSSAMTEETLLKNDESWKVLVRQASLLLLQSVAQNPRSKYALAHLRVLGILISHELDYLLDHGLYSYLGRAISNIPLEAKSSASLPPLVSLVTSPLSSPRAFPDLVVYILTIPLLPNRLPLASLTTLSSRIPYAQFTALEPSRIVASLEGVSAAHLLANLLAFTPPRYSALPPPALGGYLHLFAALLAIFPANSFEPPKARSTPSRPTALSDSDSDSDAPASTTVRVVSTFNAPPPLPSFDQRTTKRLLVLPSPSHIHSLLSTRAPRPALISFFCSLGVSWPAKWGRVLGAVVVHTGGGLIREIYRSYVRGTGLGRDDNPTKLMDPAHAQHWPSLLFLADLYTQSLLTMGDDEFFAPASNATSAPRNPLTLDELTSFSRQLLNIAFVLYWREDQAGIAEGTVPGLNGGLRWEGAREKVTRCLQAIHARDSRRSFTPPGHWLVSSQIDMHSFVEAALAEERQLTSETDLRGRQSKAQIAFMSPRLGVLHNIPFAIPFEVRVGVFRHFVANDMLSRGRLESYGGGRMHQVHNWGAGRTHVSVRRGNVAQDGFDKLGEADLKSPVEITFIDQFGQEEAGIDGGGVFKEFFTSLCREVFDTDRGLWLATKQNELYPNPHAYATEPHSLNWYRFIGRILGKAMYEGILVDVAFAGFFLAKWLEKQSFLDDLASLDPELYQGLIFLKHYTGNPEELSLNFTVAIDEFGVTKTIDLIPNGSNIAVTRENRLQYIHLVSHYRLTKQIKLQSEAFFEGLSEMIDPKWLKMFNQQEVQILLGGVNSPVDLEDLRRHTAYGGVYDDAEETIVAFWKTVNSFDQEQRRALLRFVTSCSRPPLLGFKELVPNFSIRDAGNDESRLPTASTCVNLLKLPRYKSERVLRQKLLQAIHSGAGFDLS
ncbi:hypothetical protein PLICRDRAFT_180633 [Plicaturopsis crispa FD-325 SS-3]|uniref:HECT-type E3 ubiquitin transferase n=1 Tax=Plicaturopsis crispa FD-325 SS-3 TaxID=944288 RepID=A0A0C9T215_PLICR|nr:hypothetical protein PLICRDRAFT_180633 [Plicaturopsis crispa FD-325 SS-3]